MGLIFHGLIRRDLRSVLAYYGEEVGPELAERFYQEFDQYIAEHKAIFKRLGIKK